MMGKIKNLFKKDEIDGMDVKYIERELFEELRKDYIELREKHEKLEAEHSELVDKVDTWKLLIKGMIEEVTNDNEED